MSAPGRPDPPTALGAAGRSLWTKITTRTAIDDPAGDLDGAQLVVLEEACRARDRLVRLNALETDDPKLALAVAKEVRQQALLMQQMLTAMRLADVLTGRRPARRPPRGAYRPRRFS